MTILQSHAQTCKGFACETINRRQARAYLHQRGQHAKDRRSSWPVASTGFPHPAPRSDWRECRELRTSIRDSRSGRRSAGNSQRPSARSRPRSSHPVQWRASRIRGKTATPPRCRFLGRSVSDFRQSGMDQRIHRRKRLEGARSSARKRVARRKSRRAASSLAFRQVA